MPAATEIDLGGHPALAQRPRGARAAYLFAHGAGAGMRHAFMAAVADALVARGIAVVRWELPYMAAGKARPDPAAVAERAVGEAYAAFAARHAGLALFAGGKSFGGRMTSRAHANAAAVEAAAKATAKATSTSTPTSTSSPTSTSKAVAAGPTGPLAGLRGLVFFGFPLHPPDAPATDRAAHLRDARGDLLFLQGDRDELADLALLRPTVAAFGPRARLHVIAHADHGFDVLVRSGRRPAEVIAELADAASSWMLARV